MHLLNKRVLVKHIFQNFAEPAAGFLPPQLAGLDPGVGMDDFSPEKARRLLLEAGLGKGFSCSLYSSEGQFGLEDITRTIVTNAHQINIRLKIVKLPFARVFQAVQNGDSRPVPAGLGLYR